MNHDTDTDTDTVGLMMEFEARKAAAVRKMHERKQALPAADLIRQHTLVSPEGAAELREMFNV